MREKIVEYKVIIQVCIVYSGFIFLAGLAVLLIPIIRGHFDLYLVLTGLVSMVVSGGIALVLFLLSHIEEGPSTLCIQIEDLTKRRLKWFSTSKIRKITKNVLILLSEDSGYGSGLCSFAFWGIYNLMPIEPDWGSVVATRVPIERYSRNELIKMLLFAKKMTAEYDEIVGHRKRSNIITLDKTSSGLWVVKKLTWDQGRYFKVLDDAITFFLDAYFRIYHEEKIEHNIKNK